MIDYLKKGESEFDTIGTSVKAALVYLGAALVKLVCLATFLNASEIESFNPYQSLSNSLRPQDNGYWNLLLPLQVVKVP
ncbi:hypothetical protein Ancab_028902 [Ancistrocladus abbreviatus]